MKILSLHIKNVRGIRELSLNPEGGNIVIWGLNGSGKSAVVDALDFLLTGRMNRLLGSGTAGITLRLHGPHIDCADLSDAYVTAKIRLPNVTEEIEITRRLDDPTNLFRSSEVGNSVLEAVLSLSGRGQHVLTRREILKFVTAEGKERSHQIQLLLNLKEIESTRSALVTVLNNFKRSHAHAKTTFSRAMTDLSETTSIRPLKEGEVLDFINQHRAILEASPFEQLRYSDLHEGVHPPSSITKAAVINPVLAVQDLGRLKESVVSAISEGILGMDVSLVSELEKITNDPVLVKNLRRKQLIDLGIDLVDDGGSCPLCDSEWPDGELCLYLGQKQEKANIGGIYVATIDRIIETITRLMLPVTSALKRALEVSETLGMKEEINFLQKWRDEMEPLGPLLAAISKDYEIPAGQTVRISDHFNKPELDGILKRIEEKISTDVPTRTPEQTAWDLLTRLEANLKVYRRERRLLKQTRKNEDKAEVALKSFTDSRDAVLTALYAQVRGSFVSLYKELHGDDEASFAASLEPTAAGIKFEVDFYGRGQHPPHALHSEGHQDSMGVCLYLALASQLSKGLLDVIILDDVVMSVDIEHRRQLCNVLLNNFKDKQFIITTHDQTWAQMLNKQGLVTKKGLVNFVNWTVDKGPTVNDYEDLWQLIDKDLKRGDVSGAAATLRRGAEQFFYEACERLQADIRFKSGGQWDLGDLSAAAISAIKKLVKKAKDSANSWKNTERLNIIQSFEDKLSQAIEKSNLEQWAINPLVHYSSWMNMTASEFQAVVDAFKDLFEVFKCRAECKRIFYVTSSGLTPDAFRCFCGSVNWPLNKKV